MYFFIQLAKSRIPHCLTWKEAHRLQRREHRAGDSNTHTFQLYAPAATENVPTTGNLSKSLQFVKIQKSVIKNIDSRKIFMESMFFKYYMPLYLHMSQTTKLTTVRQSYKQTPIHNFIFTKGSNAHIFPAFIHNAKGR